jgi:phosphinothricin acetyltransferase
VSQRFAGRTIYNHYVEHSVTTFDVEPTTVENRAAWFETFSNSGPHRLLVACEGKRVVGYASSSPFRAHPAFSHTVEISVYLRPQVHARGIGSALYRSLLGSLESEDIHVALAGIALPNDASIALHRKFGFTTLGIFDEYALKHGVYISSVWMQRRM